MENTENRSSLLLIITGLLFFNPAIAQHEYPTAAPQALASFYNGMDKLSQTYDSANGSPYFSQDWMKGQAQLTLKHSIPEPNETLFFNFDKTSNTLIVADAAGNLTYYNSNLLISFQLIDSTNKAYSFKKVPLISSSLFLEDLISSNKGYSLYKRYIVKHYISNQLGTLGKEGPDVPHDVYESVIMYYVLFPDKGSFKSFQLNEKSFKKAMKGEPVDLDVPLANYNGTFKEEALIEIINQINLKQQ
jgi:hypothetical protein